LPLKMFFFFFSSRRRHTRSKRDWSSDVCSSDLACVLVSYDNQLTYEKIQDTCQILSTRPEVGYIATNLDYVCPIEFGYVPDCGEIGRASCRERVYFDVVELAIKENKSNVHLVW